MNKVIISIVLAVAIMLLFFGIDLPQDIFRQGLDQSLV
jgi:hypothetical protein